MASFLCGSFHALSEYHYLQMTGHIWNRQMAFLLCGSSHDVFKVPLSVNDWSHLEQANALFSLWILSCSFKVPLLLNVLSHFKQANGLFPLWILSCSFRVPLSANDWSHLEQANGFSPVWIFSWRFQSTTICKWLVTFGTGKCSLFIVNPFMLFQSATLAEWSMTKDFLLCECLNDSLLQWKHVSSSKNLG